MFMGGMGKLNLHTMFEFDKPWWRPTYQGWIGFFTLSSKIHIGAQKHFKLGPS
jgi:hypothetical protein